MKKYNYKDRRFIQEKATGLFFGPVQNGLPVPPLEHPHQPEFEREKAWLYTEKEALAVIRKHYGGDHGADLVNLVPCDMEAHATWCGRKGGMSKSPRKNYSSPLNGTKPKRYRNGKLVKPKPIKEPDYDKPT